MVRSCTTASARLVTILLFVVLTVPLGAFASEVVRDPKSWDFAPLLYTDIIVRGEVVGAETVTIKSADLRMDTTPDNLTQSLLRVSLAKSEVLRGPEVGDQFTFLCTSDLREASSFYVVGRQVLVCAKYHPKLESYFQPSAYGRYWREGEVWRSQFTARGTREFDDKQLTEKIRSVDLAHVSTEAELVINGTIVSSETSEIVGPDGSSAELLRVLLRINRVQKGHFTDPEITVVAITGGLYLPPWCAHVPPARVYTAGQRWLCFLKKNEIGWYPFAGTNGFLRVAGTKYVYDERVEFWHSTKTVDKVVMEASGNH